MKIMSRNVFLFVVFAMGLYGCGGGGDGSPPPASTPPPPPPTVGDVTIDKLAGSWYGTYDTGSLVSLKLTFSATGTAITVDEVNGVPSDLTGTVTKDGPTSFRFTISNPSNTVQNQGMLLTDQAAAYLMFVGDTVGAREFGVLQKNAAAPLQTHTQTDVNGSWAGHTSAAGATFASLAPKTSNATCAPAAPAAPAGPSACTATLSDRTRSIPGFTLSEPNGRWQESNYTDTPQTGAPQNGTTQAFISQDKKFVGVWACTDPTSFPANCDYSAWTKP